MCKTMLGHLVHHHVCHYTMCQLKKQKSQTLTHDVNCNWGLTSGNQRVSQSLEYAPE